MQIQVAFAPFISVSKRQSQKAFAIYSAFFFLLCIEPRVGQDILFICLYMCILKLLKRVQETLTREESVWKLGTVERKSVLWHAFLFFAFCEQEKHNWALCELAANAHTSLYFHIINNFNSYFNCSSLSVIVYIFLDTNQFKWIFLFCSQNPTNCSISAKHKKFLHRFRTYLA